MSETDFDAPVVTETPDVTDAVTEGDPWAEPANADSDFLLGDLGLDDVSANPNFVADGGYVAVVTYKVGGSKKNPNHRYLIFSYAIETTADGSPTEYKDKKISEWKSAMPDDDAQTKSFLKQRIMSFGVPEEEVSRFNMQTVQGGRFLIEVKNNGDFTNINRVKPLGEGGVTGAASGSSGSIDF